MAKKRKPTMGKVEPAFPEEPINPNAPSITEKDGIHEKWYEEARSMTIENLPQFMKKLTENYNHDYGTICHAISAAAIAAAYAIEHSPQGGITGFQSGAVMWEFIRHWSYHGDKNLTARLVDYSDLLYPQMEYKFKSISSDTLKYIQERASFLLNEDRGYPVSEEVKRHWESIIEGNVPFNLEIMED